MANFLSLWGEFFGHVNRERKSGPIALAKSAMAIGVNRDRHVAGICQTWTENSVSRIYGFFEIQSFHFRDEVVENQDSYLICQKLQNNLISKLFLEFKSTDATSAHLNSVCFPASYFCFQLSRETREKYRKVSFIFCFTIMRSSFILTSDSKHKITLDSLKS